MPGTPVVFAGPSLGEAHARAALPGAVILPPARCGDVLSVLRLRPAAIVLIDGLYDTTPAPWHKELLWALEARVPVVGAASMGALRAAELDRFGMIGVGSIYESYRDGIWQADDEVAVLQARGPDGDRAVTDALADIRQVVADLARAGLLTGAEADRVVAVARAVHFSERTLTGALRSAGLAPATLARILGWPPRPGHLPQKRADAYAALRLAAGGLAPPRPAERVARTAHILRLAARASLRPLGRPDPALPAAEQALASDPSLARAAALAGGLLRAAAATLPPPAAAPPPAGSAPPPTAAGLGPLAGVPAAGDRHPLAAAAVIASSELADHPGAVASAARLRRLASALAPVPPAGQSGSGLRGVLEQLAGPAATGPLIELMTVAADSARDLLAGRWQSPDGPVASEEAVAEAARLLPDPGMAGDALDIAAGRGRLRAAAQVMELVLLGGGATARCAPLVDPCDAPLLDGLAVLRAVGAASLVRPSDGLPAA